MGRGKKWGSLTTKFKHQEDKIMPGSLTRTLALLSLCISGFVLVVISSLVSYFTYNIQKQAIERQQAQISVTAASTVKSFVQDKINALNSTVQFNFLGGVPATSPMSTLEKLLSLEPAFNEVAILNAEGNVVGQAVATPDLYDATITSQINKTQLLDTVTHNKDFISNVYIDQGSGEPQVIIAVPVNSVYTGYSGTLLAETNLKFMWTLVGNIKDGPHGVAYVVDQRGDLIAAGDTSRVLKQENLSNLTVVKKFIESNDSTNVQSFHDRPGFNSNNVETTYAGLGRPNWAVITEIPIYEAYAPVIKTIIISTSLFIAGIILSIIASVIFARRITRPIIALRDTLTSFGSGDFKVRADTSTNNEIGELGSVFNTMVDNLAKSRVQLEASINSLNVGFIMIDLDSKVVVNPAAIDILHRTPDGKITSSNIDEILSLDVIDSRLGATIGLKAAVRDTMTSLKILDRKAVDFNSRILHIYIAPILSTVTSTVVLGAVVLIEDTTEEKILERSKDEFFSIASHELRTPLTSIKGNASMILDFYTDVLKDPQLKEMVSDIHTSAVRLIDIVNDFLDVSRLEQGKMSFDYAPTSLEKVIEGVVYEMKVVLNEKKIYLHSDKMTLNTLPTVWADANRLKQVVYNLIGNAAKFTEAGGIIITTELEKDKNLIKVILSDTGRGMTPESQQLLFHKFQQASSSLLTRDTTRGTGLGLYISKMIIESMGGHIALESSVVGKGTVFSFTIPIASIEQLASIHSVAITVDASTGMEIKPAMPPEHNPDPMSQP